MKDESQTLFSGVQPTGTLHIGNYLGAIKQFVELQHEYQSFFCVADQHAITMPQDPEELRKNTLDVATMYMAAGIDPKKSVIFVQSHVPAHTELGWILNTLTPLGELERMTQFKEKTGQRGKRGIFAGLFNYPTLMAADILLYQTHKVPVGEDQLQHIELTRSLAERFNNHFGQTFIVPEPLIHTDTARIMGLDDPTKKMSKSASSSANYIALLDPPDEIRKKIKSAVTDSGKQIIYDEKGKPAITNLLRIFSAFAGAPIKDIEKQYAHKGYADFKDDCAEIIIEQLKPLQKKYHELTKDPIHVTHILREGAHRAEAVAEKTFHDVKQKIGFLALD